MWLNLTSISTLFASALLIAGARARAQSVPSAAGMSERSVAEVLHVSNAGEAQLATIASRRASDPAVRSYAQRMLAEHMAADEALLSVQGTTERWGLTREGPTLDVANAVPGGAAGAGSSTTVSVVSTASSSSTGTMATSGAIGTTGAAGYAGAGGNGTNGTMTMSNLPNASPTSVLLSSSTNASLASDVQHNAMHTMVQLSSRSGADFDRAYIDNQVAMHAALLEKIDSTLLPAAKDAQLHALLEKTRASVAEHLKMARKIQSKLGS